MQTTQKPPATHLALPIKDMEAIHAYITARPYAEVENVAFIFKNVRPCSFVEEAAQVKKEELKMPAPLLPDEPIAPISNNMSETQI